MTTEPDRSNPTDARDVPEHHVPDEPAPEPTDRPTVTMLRGAGWTTLRVAGYPNEWVVARNDDTVSLGDAQ